MDTINLGGEMKSAGETCRMRQNMDDIRHPCRISVFNSIVVFVHFNFRKGLERRTVAMGYSVPSFRSISF